MESIAESNYQSMANSYLLGFLDNDPNAEVDLSISHPRTRLPDSDRLENPIENRLHHRQGRQRAPTTCQHV